MLGVLNPPQKKGGCLLWHLKILSRLAVPHPSCSVLIPTSLWVKFCNTTIMCMMHVLPYTNSWGAPIVGPGLLLTFTIFSHHSFKCTDPPPPESESKVGLYAQNRKRFFVMGSRTIPDAVLCFDHGTHISTLLNTINPRIGWLNKKECERCIFPVVSS